MERASSAAFLFFCPRAAIRKRPTAATEPRADADGRTDEPPMGGRGGETAQRSKRRHGQLSIELASLTVVQPTSAARPPKTIEMRLVVYVERPARRWKKGNKVNDITHRSSVRSRSYICASSKFVLSA